MGHLLYVIALGRGFKFLLLLSMAATNSLMPVQRFTLPAGTYITHRVLSTFPSYTYFFGLILGFRVYCEHLYAMGSRHSFFSCIHNAKYTLITAVQTYLFLILG